MVPTDTHGHSGDVGHRSVALTWSSVVDGRPDRPSRGRRRIVSDVCRECSSKSTHCSKVHGSYHPRTIGLDSFTRRPVWTRRASHPAPSGRPPRGGAKVTWFRYSCEYLGYSREDSRDLITDPRQRKQRARYFDPRASGGMSRTRALENAATERPLRTKRTRPNESIQRKQTSRPVLSHLKKKRGL